MQPLPKILVGLITTFFSVQAADLSSQAWQLERTGDAAGALALLRQGAAARPADPAALVAFAEYLDRHHDPGTRAAYRAALEAAPTAARAPIARRLTLLDVLANDRAAATTDLAVYRGSGATDLVLPAEMKKAQAATITIPGPLRSFSRMAALAPDTSNDEFLAMLARNIFADGYQATRSNEALEPTEYLKLVTRYLTQARELEKLAGADKFIRIDTCDSAQTGDLLRVLGYRLRGACGGELTLETVNGARAFLTIDSGFPLAELEQDLRLNRAFAYDFHPSQVSVLFGADYWMSGKDKNLDFIDSFIGDPSVCRLYLALSKLEPQIGDELRRTVPQQRLRAFAHVLDFYGGMFELRGGKAMVPGGARSEHAWADLTGVSPEKGGPFFERLVAKDDGWMASYYDALARVTDPAVQQYLTEPERLKRFYGAIRGKVTSPGPARPVFRANTEMLLLTARLRMDADNQPHIPGNLDTWKSLFTDHARGKIDAKLVRAAPSWKEPDDVIEALFGLSHKMVENEPLKIFMALSDVDRLRATPLSAPMVGRLVHAYANYGAQYALLAEASTLSEPTIGKLLDAWQETSEIHDQSLRSDAAGSLQGLIGIWQICYRQGSIPPSEADKSLSAVLNGFGKLKSEREVFDASRDGVRVILAAAHVPADVPVQDAMFDTLAGTSEHADSEARTQFIEDKIRLFEAQRLISLSTLFDLADNLERVAKGEKANTALLGKMTSRISEMQLPRESMSAAEKSAYAPGYWPERHIEAQRKLNLRAFVDKATTDPKKMDDVRGMMAPFVRDTLVGFNYIYYAPPGAEVLRSNPLFVRSHDFIGLPGMNHTFRITEVTGSSYGSTSGGRLTGSLAGLPYALAEAEQNFLVPKKEQALIWGDLVPQMLVSATVPRWWAVTPAQIHWVGLHMEYAEALTAEATLNAARRQALMQKLSSYSPPARVSKVDTLLAEGQTSRALENLMPAEMFSLASAFAKTDHDSPLAAEIRREAADAPAELNYDAIGRAFGTPKPTLTNSYAPGLLHLRTFPTLMGFSSRILAETWESNLLYYAALADQLHASPSQMNLLVPEWTQHTVESVFATHLEDWPALLRSLRVVGEEARQKTQKQPGLDVTGSN